MSDGRAERIAKQRAHPDFQTIVEACDAAARLCVYERAYFILNSPDISAAAVEDELLMDGRVAMGFRSGAWEIWNGFNPNLTATTVVVQRVKETPCRTRGI